MIKIENSLVETREIYKEILKNPGRLFELMRFNIKELAERVLCELLKEELNIFLGRGHYERSKEVSPNYRNGSSSKRYTVKDIGELNIKVPRDRKGEYNSRLISKYNRYDKALEQDISLLFLSGLSMRNIGLISKNILGRKISAGEVSKINGELLSGIDKWRLRDLSQAKIKYMYIDGVNFHIRVGHKVDIVPMLVVIGVTISNRKVFLAIHEDAY